MTRTLNGRRVLLVEGESDKHFVWHMLGRTAEGNEMRKTLVVQAKGGVDKVLPAIGAQARVAGTVAVGAVVDANEDVDSRWTDIRESFAVASVTIPKSPVPGGVVVEGGALAPRTGVWMMPNNKGPGELEDLVATMLPSGDPVRDLARNYIDSIDDAHRKFRRKKELRAKIHAWLATLETPGRIGVAVKDGDLAIDGELAASFMAWLMRMFADAA